MKNGFEGRRIENTVEGDLEWVTQSGTVHGGLSESAG